MAAVEILSPANKDRTESRQLFITKCANLLRNDVCVSLVDLVTVRRFNLYTELLTLLGQTDPSMSPDPPPIYAATCRKRQAGRQTKLDTWALPLKVGELLPPLYIWLTETVIVSLDLEAAYEQTCCSANRVSCLRTTPGSTFWLEEPSEPGSTNPASNWVSHPSTNVIGKGFRMAFSIHRPGTGKAGMTSHFVWRQANRNQVGLTRLLSGRPSAGHELCVVPPEPRPGCQPSSRVTLGKESGLCYAKTKGETVYDHSFTSKFGKPHPGRR